MDKKLIVIAGPTGSGKTDLSIAVAEHFGTEIVSTDSRQLYRGMPVGTAQPSADQLAAVPHHFIAEYDITEHYTCGRYETEALARLEKLFARHDVVVAVGGSGLYIDALCHGVDPLPEADPELRARLSQTPLEALLAQLQTLDPAYFDRVDRHNPRRVARAVEVCLQTGCPYSSLRLGHHSPRKFDIVRIGLQLPRPELYARINSRVDAMIATGLVDEARKLYPHRTLNALQTVGYREMFVHFDGLTTLPQAIDLIKQNSRRYAKRQITWFSRNHDTTWLNPNDDPNKLIAKIIQRF